MVRYSDIIKSDAEKKDISHIKNNQTIADASSKADSLLFSDMQKLNKSSSLTSLPKQNDTGYMKELYSTIMEYIKGVKHNVKNDKVFDIEQAVNIVERFINNRDLIQNFYLATALSSHDEDYFVSNPANTLIYALKIGSGLKYSQDNLLELGLCGLLYDVGLFKIPESISMKKGRLTESERNIIKKHAEMGRDILSPFKEKHNMLHRVAYEHHERENGHGYPRGIKGKEICDFAKIVGLVDTYEAMIHNRPHRKGLSQHISVKELIGSKGLLFSSEIIKIYLLEFGIFPIGSYVRLNNRAIGKVIQTSKTHPLRPVVKLLYDSQENKVINGETINLNEHPVLYIAKEMSAKEISAKDAEITSDYDYMLERR